MRAYLYFADGRILDIEVSEPPPTAVVLPVFEWFRPDAGPGECPAVFGALKLPLVARHDDFAIYRE